MSKQGREEFLARVWAAFDLVYAKYPEAFSDGFTQPLALGVDAVLAKENPEIGRRVLASFLHRYTKTDAYLRALVVCQRRVNLDGTPACEVASTHRDAAIQKLAERQSRLLQKRAA